MGSRHSWTWAKLNLGFFSFFAFVFLTIFFNTGRCSPAEDCSVCRALPSPRTSEAEPGAFAGAGVGSIALAGVCSVLLLDWTAGVVDAKSSSVVDLSVTTLEPEAGVGADAISVTEDGLTWDLGVRAIAGERAGDSLSDADTERDLPVGVAIATSCSCAARRLLNSFRALTAATQSLGIPASITSSSACCSGPTDPSLVAFAVAATNARAYVTMPFGVEGGA